MEQKFDNATLKVWFTASSRCRNFTNVTETRKAADELEIVSNDQNIILNWQNITVIEVITNDKTQGI